MTLNPISTLSAIIYNRIWIEPRGYRMSRSIVMFKRKWNWRCRDSHPITDRWYYPKSQRNVECLLLSCAIKTAPDHLSAFPRYSLLFQYSPTTLTIRHIKPNEWSPPTHETSLPANKKKIFLLVRYAVRQSALGSMASNASPLSPPCHKDHKQAPMSGHQDSWRILSLGVLTRGSLIGNTSLQQKRN